MSRFSCQQLESIDYEYSHKSRRKLIFHLTREEVAKHKLKYADVQMVVEDVHDLARILKMLQTWKHQLTGKPLFKLPEVGEN